MLSRIREFLNKLRFKRNHEKDEEILESKILGSDIFELVGIYNLSTHMGLYDTEDVLFNIKLNISNDDKNTLNILSKIFGVLKIIHGDIFDNGISINILLDNYIIECALSNENFYEDISNLDVSILKGLQQCIKYTRSEYRSGGISTIEYDEIPKDKEFKVLQKTNGLCMVISLDTDNKFILFNMDKLFEYFKKYKSNADEIDFTTLFTYESKHFGLCRYEYIDGLYFQDVLEYSDDMVTDSEGNRIYSIDDLIRLFPDEIE